MADVPSAAVAAKWRFDALPNQAGRIGKVRAKMPDMAAGVDVFIANPEDAITTDARADRPSIISGQFPDGLR